MNKLLMKKALTLSMTILLTLATLLSIVGSAMAEENRVALVAFVWFLNYWNLLGWRY